MVYIFLVLQFLPFIIIPIIIISASVRARRNSKANDLPKFENTISNANDLEAHWNSISSEDTSIYCEYCGSKMERVRKRCVSCGARVQSKNK